MPGRGNYRTGRRRACPAAEMMLPATSTRPTPRRAFALGIVAVLAAAGGTAVAQDLESERAAKQSELENVKDRGDVLSSEISDYSDQIAPARGGGGDPAQPRGRGRAAAARDRSPASRPRRRTSPSFATSSTRSLDILAERLVDIYKSDQPDALTVILDSEGFDDLVNRYDYLTRIQDQDAAIVARVRFLRDESTGDRGADPDRQARRSRRRRRSSSAHGCSSRLARPSSTRCATRRPPRSTRSRPPPRSSRATSPT